MTCLVQIAPGTNLFDRGKWCTKPARTASRLTRVVDFDDAACRPSDANSATKWADFSVVVHKKKDGNGGAPSSDRGCGIHKGGGKGGKGGLSTLANR